MFHKEGQKIILGTLFFVGGSFLVLDNIIELQWLIKLLQLSLLAVLVLILQFFRNPKRHTQKNDARVISPVDGKVVVIEEVEETEYFKDKRIQVSIFMSPLNVHANYYPIKGRLPFVKYHPGKFLVAWHPKSSTENERTTIVISNDKGVEILVRQIAGAVARRICYYGQEEEHVEQGGELGFIKFGSRVDLFLPLDTKVDVKLEDKVQAKLTSIGFLS